MLLKNIIYIDYEKVYSLSAQLFEGLVHTATKHKDVSLENTETIVMKESSKSISEGDRGSLSTVINPHDYNYLKFEKELEDSDQIFSIKNDKVDIESLLEKPFVKIKARVNLIDYARLKFTTKNFNKISYSLNYISQNEKLLEISSLLKGASPSNKKKLQDVKRDILESVDERSMMNQKDFLYHLSEVFDYAYGEDVEITQQVGDLSATSFFIKDFFKIPLEMFIKRYSRKTIKEFTIVGTVSQVYRASNSTDPQFEPNNMRSAVAKMSDALYDIETSFCTPQKNEIFIEPIAMYSEV